MSDERHIDDLISDNEKIYVELRSVVGQLKACVGTLKEISECGSFEIANILARGALIKIDKKYK